jgi:hypothetical protein
VLRSRKKRWGTVAGDQAYMKTDAGLGPGVEGECPCGRMVGFQ